MRSVVSFVIGSILGATAVLLYLQNTRQLAIASEMPVVSERLPTARQRATGERQLNALKPGRALKPGQLLIPVVGVGAEALRDDFHRPRSGGRSHGALDILAPLGTPVVATTDGTIRKLFTSRAGGITIYQTDPEEEKIYYYAHLDRYAAGLTEGMKVSRGTVIGFVGTTGNAPVGTPHLHFAIMKLPPTKEWWKGDPMDPYPLLVGR